MAVIDLFYSIYHCASTLIRMKKAANRNVLALSHFPSVVCHYGCDEQVIDRARPYWSNPAISFRHYSSSFNSSTSTSIPDVKKV